MEGRGGEQYEHTLVPVKILSDIPTDLEYQCWFRFHGLIHFRRSRAFGH